MRSRKRTRAKAPERKQVPERERKQVIGWLERVEVRLPHSDAPPLRLRAKIDTGADASVLHARAVEVDGHVARFSVFRPKRRRSDRRPSSCCCR